MCFCSVQNLYQPDARIGDSLLNPQRWCQLQWENLVSEVDCDDGASTVAGEVLFRIFSVIPLIFATLGSCGIGVVGIGLKACQGPEDTGSYLENPYPQLQISPKKTG